MHETVGIRMRVVFGSFSTHYKYVFHLLLLFGRYFSGHFMSRLFEVGDNVCGGYVRMRARVCVCVL